VNDPQTEAIEAVEDDAPGLAGVGAKALALAGFAETALADAADTLVSGHSGIMTWTFVG
jgi:hypothetical protein